MKLFIIFFFICLLSCVDLKSQQNKDPWENWKEPNTGFFIEFGPLIRGFSSPYKSEFSTQEIISLQAGNATVTFEEPRTRFRKWSFRIMTGYKLYDFNFFTEINFLASERVNAYSYSWADPTLKCSDRWAGPIGCEIAFIKTDVSPIYILGFGYNIWNDFYIKLTGQTQNIDLVLGREAYSSENQEVERIIYNERIYAYSAGLDYILTKRHYPLRIIASYGYTISRGELTRDDSYYIGLSVGILFDPF